MRRIIAVAASALVVMMIAPSPNAGAHNPEAGGAVSLRTYDPDAFELPEGLAVDETGRLYLTMPFLGQLRRVDRDGSEHLVANLPTGGGFGPLGVAVDSPGNLYVAVVTLDSTTQGVYRVSITGDIMRLPGTEAISFANALTLDDKGALYVTDSTGKIWRIPRRGPAQLWSDDQLLVGDGSAGFGFPVGANGIAYRDRTVYVTNTELASIVAIPVRPDGSAGAASVVVQDPALEGADGLELDVFGNFFVAVITQSTILRVSSGGSAIDVLVDGRDGIDWVSNIAFGTAMGDRTTLYAVNFSIAPFFGGIRTWGPALLAIEAGVPGLP